MQRQDSGSGPSSKRVGPSVFCSLVLEEKMQTFNPKQPSKPRTKSRESIGETQVLLQQSSFRFHSSIFTSQWLTKDNCRSARRKTANPPRRSTLTTRSETPGPTLNKPPCKGTGVLKLKMLLKVSLFRHPVIPFKIGSIVSGGCLSISGIAAGEQTNDVEITNKDDVGPTGEGDEEFLQCNDIHSALLAFVFIF